MPEQEVAGLPAVEGLKAQMTLYRTYLNTPATQGKLRLFKNGFAPTKDSVLADFVAQENAFGGYAVVTPTYNALSLDQSGQWVFTTSRAFFQVTGAPLTESVGGWWLDDGTQVQHYGVFPAPIPMTTVGEFIAVALTIAGITTPANADVQS